MCAGAGAQAASTTLLTLTQGGAAVSSVGPATAVTLTATVAAGSTAVTPGQVTFCDAAAATCTDVHALGTVQLKAGIAKLTLLPGAAGVHRYQARFLGTGTAAGSVSAVAQVTVVPVATPPGMSVNLLGSTGVAGNYTLFANVSGSGMSAPTGVVSFADASNANYGLGTATLGAGPAGLSYTMGASYATGQFVDEMAVGDFNGDGFPDIVTVSSSGSTPITVLMNKGDGTFRTMPSIAGTTDSASSLAVGDFNGDGNLDIAIGDSFQGMVLILLGNGDGTFRRGATAVLPAYSSNNTVGVFSIAVGDFNRDGIADLAVVDPWSSTLRVLLGRGDGTFAIQAAHPAVGSNPLDVVAGDFNGDGKLDLIVCNLFGPGSSLTLPAPLNVFLGNGDGTFTKVADVPIAPGGEQIFAADFDGDGKLDLVVNHSGSAPGAFETLSGNGDGTFTARVPSSSPIYLVGVGIGDLNGDGRPDFGAAFAQRTGNVAGLIGNGDGTFTLSQTGTDSYEIPSVAVVADFKGQGYGEIAIGNQQSGVTIMEPRFTGAATATVTGVSIVGTGTHFATASYSGDANYAASTSNQLPLQAQRVVTALGLTASSASSAQGQGVTLTASLDKFNAQNHTATQAVTFLSNGTSVGTAAVTNGVASLVVSNLAAGTDSLTASYVGDTNFAPSTSGAVAHQVTSQSSGAVTATTLTITAGGAVTSTVAQGTVVTLTTAVTVAGAPVSPGQVRFCDALATYCTGAHLLGTAALTPAGTAALRLRPGLGGYVYKAVFVGTNTRQTSTSAVAALTVTGTPKATAILNVTGGSPGNYTLTTTVLGLGAVTPSGTVSFQDITNANYVLAQATLVAKTGGVTLQNVSNPPFTGVPYGVGLADFNGDGVLDLVAANASGSTLSVYLGNGDGTFTLKSNPVTGSEPNYFAIGDFNGDGKLDVAVSNYKSNTVTVLLGNGDGTFTAAPSSPATGSYPYSVATGDFNGDGRLDLAVANSGGNSLTILLGNGDGTFTAAPSVTTGTEPVQVMVADFNGDGIADLVANNTVSQTVSISLGNGDGTFRTLPASAPLNTLVGNFNIGDLNGDGIPDLVALGENPFQTLILLGNGDGTFRLAQTLPTSLFGAVTSLSEAVGVADFNGDGIPDLAISNVNDNMATSNYVAIYLGKGDGTFQTTAAAQAGTGIQPGALTIGDVNGDGQQDIVTANNFSSNLGVFLLANNATATVTGISPVGNGTHLVDALYSGDASYAGVTSNTIALLAQPVLTTLALTASSATTVFGQPVTLTATLTPFTAQNHTATQTVTFLSNGTSVGTAAVVNGLAVLTLSSLPVGTDNLVASYSGDVNFQPSTSATLPHVVTQPAAGTQTISFAQPPTPAAVGTSILLSATATSGLPVTFTLLSGPATLTGNLLTYMGAGTVVVAADQAGNSSYSAAPQVIRSVVVTVQLATTNVTLTATPNPALLGAPVTLTAAVGSATGTVTFQEGTSVLGSAPINAGTATLILNSLALGAHAITAIYGGSPTYSPAMSPAVLVTIQDFALAALNPHATIPHGGAATYSLLLSTAGGAGTGSMVNLSVSGAPIYSVITFTPASVPVGSGTVPVTMVVQTPNYPTGPFSLNRITGAATISLACLALLLPFRRYRGRALLLLLAALTIGLAGCGSGWRAQDWTMTVTATSGSLTRTATVYLHSQCQDGQPACPITK